MAPPGRYAVTAGSGAIGDLVVTRTVYQPATNSVTTTAANVLFPGGADLRPQSRPSITADGRFVAAIGSSPSADLVVVPVSPFGVPGAAQAVAYPGSVNVDPSQVAPLVDPNGDWVVTAGNAGADLVLTSIDIAANCLATTGAVETRAFLSSNNVGLGLLAPVASASGQIVVVAGSAANVGDLVVSPIQGARAFPLDVPRAGAINRVRFRSAADGGAFYVAGAALQPCPGITVPGGGLFPLQNDALLTFSTTPGNGAFVSFSGTLDASGNAVGFIVLPPVPELRGLPLYVAFAVLDPSGPVTLSEPASFVIR